MIPFGIYTIIRATIPSHWLGAHTETRSPLVLYKPLYSVPDLDAQYNNDVVFARPLAMFNEHVTVNGQSVERFKLTAPPPESQP